MFDDEQNDAGSSAEQASLQPVDEEVGQQSTVVVVKRGPLGKAGAVIAKAGGSAGQAAQGAAGAFGGAAKKVGGTVKGAAQGVAFTAGSAVGAVRSRVSHKSDKESAAVEDDASAEVCGDAAVHARLVRPEPILDERELRSLETLTEHAEKFEKPGLLARAGEKVVKYVPDALKDGVADAAGSISEKELYKKLMDVLASGFSTIEEFAARVTTSEKAVLRRANAVSGELVLTELGHVSFMRSYDIERIADKDRVAHLAAALGEGAATGAPGAAGIPFNIVLSTFLYYRAVQSIAMCYGYDTRNDPAELQVASEVFSKAFGVEEGTEHIAKFMAYGQLAAAKDAAKKGWTAMAEREGLALLAAQIRALANKSAARALENAGKESLEKTVFSELLEQLGKKLTLKNAGRAVPVLGAIVGGLFDVATMRKVLDYADTFYNKRFIAEKETRIEVYLPEVASDAPVEVDCVSLDA